MHKTVVKKFALRYNGEDRFPGIRIRPEDRSEMRSCIMKQKIRWITQTAVLLALLVALQAITKPFGQLVTGSFVNAVLAVAAALGGLSCGLTVALVSPVLAFFLGIAPQVLTVPAIMLGNSAYVFLLWGLADPQGRKLGKQALALGVAAAAKFTILRAVVEGLICGVFAPTLLASGALKAPMLKVLPATFSWPQLLTALIGGTAALLITPLLKKALKQ